MSGLPEVGLAEFVAAVGGLIAAAGTVYNYLVSNRLKAKEQDLKRRELRRGDEEVEHEIDLKLAEGRLSELKRYAERLEQLEARVNALALEVQTWRERYYGLRNLIRSRGNLETNVLVDEFEVTEAEKNQ